MAYSGEMFMWVMGVPMSRCAGATWNRHVYGNHFTRYVAVRVGLVMCRVCVCVCVGLVEECGILGFDG
jgi:hypothetical protein